VRLCEGHIAFIDQESCHDLDDPEPFDRIEFAMRALAVLQPHRMTVAVYPRHRKLHVERGRDWERRDGGSWATVGIPPQASRQSIVLALAELSGHRSSPWVVDLLLHMGGK
jgi:hypothetical protein